VQPAINVFHVPPSRRGIDGKLQASGRFKKSVYWEQNSFYFYKGCCREVDTDDTINIDDFEH
jgi:hypothetical protein